MCDLAEVSASRQRAERPHGAVACVRGSSPTVREGSRSKRPRRALPHGRATAPPTRLLLTKLLVLHECLGIAVVEKYQADFAQLMIGKQEFFDGR